MYECHICQQGHLTTSSLTACLLTHSTDRLTALKLKIAAEEKLNADLVEDLSADVPVAEASEEG